MTNSPAQSDLQQIEAWCRAGDTRNLALAAQIIDTFPQGREGVTGTHWLTVAVQCGSLATVDWMLAQGASASISEPDGFPPLLACIDLTSDAKYAILQRLINAGADMNQRGINGWTPLHLAAVREDETAMRLLLEAGADRNVTTQCDDDLNAEDEARILGHIASADFIANFPR